VSSSKSKSRRKSKEKNLEISSARRELLKLGRNSKKPTKNSFRSKPKSLLRSERKTRESRSMPRKGTPSAISKKLKRMKGSRTNLLPDKSSSTDKLLSS